MKRRRAMPVPRFPGYDGDVKSAEDFAKCSTPRRMAILASLARLMEISSAKLARSDDRLAAAARAVDVVQADIATERAFLMMIASCYASYAQVIAASALEVASEPSEATK